MLKKNKKPQQSPSQYWSEPLQESSLNEIKTQKKKNSQSPTITAQENGLATIHLTITMDMAITSANISKSGLTSIKPIKMETVFPIGLKLTYSTQAH